MQVRDVELFVEENGNGPPVVFSHGLLMSGRMYAPQVEALRDRFRCITYDHRGQGRSQVPRQSVIDLETLYEDAAALIGALEAAPCHFVGLSMGGFVGLRLAARRPELVRSLVLISTAADTEPKAHLPRYRMLNLVTRLGGLRAVAGRVLPILAGDSMLGDPTRAGDVAELRRMLLANRRTIYRAVNGVLRRQSVEHELSRIRAPTLILHGDEDRAIGAARRDRLHQGIAGSRLVRIPRAGHTLTLEDPEAVNRALAEFLDGVD